MEVRIFIEVTALHFVEGMARASHWRDVDAHYLSNDWKQSLCHWSDASINFAHWAKSFIQAWSIGEKSHNG